MADPLAKVPGAWPRHVAEPPPCVCRGPTGTTAWVPGPTLSWRCRRCGTRCWPVGPEDDDPGASPRDMRTG